MFDPSQVPAADGVRWLIGEAVASPGVVAVAAVRWVLVPAAVFAAGVWAALRLIARHPDAALPEQRPAALVEPDEVQRYTAAALAGEADVEETVRLRAGGVR